MRAACHLPNRLADARSLAPPVMSLPQRIGRCVCILAVLCGQIGLPNLSQFLVAGTTEAKSAPTSDAGCQCPPALRRVGRCCCAANAKAAPSSCCAKKTSCRKESAETKKHTLAFRKSCPCDQRGDVDGYRCDDPRVLPKATLVTTVAMRAAPPVQIDSRACGELLPPPVPPPESSPS